MALEQRIARLELENAGLRLALRKAGVSEETVSAAIHRVKCDKTYADHPRNAPAPIFAEACLRGGILKLIDDYSEWSDSIRAGRNARKQG